MYIITIWNRKSTNFGANAFIGEHGTDTVRTESEYRALRLMGALINDPSTDRAILEGPNGCLTWLRYCDDCCGCPGMDDEDNQEFDLNDKT